MIWVCYFILSFLSLRVLVALTNLLTRQWLHKECSASNALVSILIPARNEAANIGKLLQNISDLDYSNYEVLVYDDESTDDTAKIVQLFSKTDKRIELLKGLPLPSGWLGKNYACHRLAMRAKGDFFLFLDADVEIEPGLIRNALYHIEKYNLDVFSIFPTQTMKSWGEKITIPLMNTILVSMLPLILVRVSSWKSFSAANGQFMFYKSTTYLKHFFHQIVKLNAVEDISILKTMKKMKYRTHTLLSNGQISCRMYNGFSEAVNGFSKNVFMFFGGSIFATLFYALVTSLGIFIIGYFMPVIYLLAFLALTILLRIMVSIASKQNIWHNLILAPVQQIAFLCIVSRAVKNKLKGQMYWKGRKIQT